MGTMGGSSIDGYEFLSSVNTHHGVHQPLMLCRSFSKVVVLISGLEAWPEEETWRSLDVPPWRWFFRPVTPTMFTSLRLASARTTNSSVWIGMGANELRFSCTVSFDHSIEEE